MKSSVERECFRLVQVIAVTKYPNCVRCGAPSTCGHHIFSRSRNATAFDPAAVLGLCAECHAWAHQYPGAGLRLAQTIVGIKEYNRLAKKSMAICRYRASDFREIRQRLREELKEQEEGKPGSMTSSLKRLVSSMKADRLHGPKRPDPYRLFRQL